MAVSQEVVSGLPVVFMGARLVWQRWAAFRNSRNPDLARAHDHSHGHTHYHGEGHTHSHLPPADDIKLSSLVAMMGASGGLVPCPDA